MRSWLFIPGDSPRKLAKAAGSGADIAIVDLEDSVSLDAKEEARQCAAEFLAGADRSSGPRLYVRINDLQTGLAEADLDSVLPARPDGILLPKCESGQMAATAAGLIEARTMALGTPVSELAIIATETAGSLFGMGSYQDAGVALSAMTWGMEDLSADLQVSKTRDGDGRPAGPFALARTLTLIAARAAGAEPIDGVYTDFRDSEGLERECAEAARDGFTGKLAIHPAQVEAINRIFSPSTEALDAAQEIVDAFAANPGAGVIGLRGKMVDRPHLIRAQKLLERASRFG